MPVRIGAPVSPRMAICTEETARPEGSLREPQDVDAEEIARRGRHAAAFLDTGGLRRSATAAGSVQASLGLWDRADEYRDAALGEILGSGGVKEVYALTHDELAVMAILKGGRSAALLQEEAEALRTLAELGLPAVRVITLTTHTGRPASVLERFAMGSKEVVRLDRGRIRQVGSSPLLNERSIRDLVNIRTTLLREQISIHDLQFLIAEDGRIAIADPLAIVLGQPPSRTNLRTIDVLIRAAQSNLASKEATE